MSSKSEWPKAIRGPTYQPWRIAKLIIAVVTGPGEIAPVKASTKEILNVADINLSNLSIKYIPKEIEQLKKLKSLNLSGNKLKRIPKEIGSLLILFGIIFVIELLIGFLLAFFGSMLAISRARKKR